MKHRILKFILVILLIFPLATSSCFKVYAEGEDISYEEKEKQAELEAKTIPNIKLISSPNYTVEAGKKATITLDFKNVTNYGASDLSIRAIPTDTSNMPFTLEFPNSSNSIVYVSSQSTKNIPLEINVDSKAESKVYSINLEYTFLNVYGKSFEGKETIYIKINNIHSSPNIVLENFKLSSNTIMPGTNADLTGTLKNIGIQTAYDVQITIDGLSTDTLTTTNNSNTLYFNHLNIGIYNDMKLTLNAAKKIKSGNYPITFKLTYKDINSKEYSSEQKYFINVGGSSEDSKTFLQIQNLTVPNRSYGVNEDFNIHLDVVNTGKTVAKNVKITANYGTDGCVVPKSPSVQLTNSIEPDSTKSFDFTFTGTSTAKTQNYPIAFDLEYEDGSEDAEGNPTIIKYTQYTGVNISNPDNVDDKDKAKSVPKIIISKYECNPIMVNAGDEFDLNMSFTNTHPTKTVSNIKIFFTVSEESKTGNVFIPVNSSNTFYVDSIGPKETVDRSVRLFAMPDAEAKTYNLTVNFDYEDNTGALPASSEFIGISVKQPTKLEMDDIVPPSEAVLGEPAYINFNFYNTGKVTLNNLMVKLTGDFESQNPSSYYGNFESGSSEYYEGSIIPTAVGKQTGKLTISYDTASGERVEKVTDIEINVTEPMAMDAMSPNGDMGMEGMEEPKPSLLKSPILWAGVVGVIIIIVVAVILFIRRKKKQKGVDLDE